MLAKYLIWLLTTITTTTTTKNKISHLFSCSNNEKNDALIKINLPFFFVNDYWHKSVIHES
jgi:hypothetical protein